MIAELGGRNDPPPGESVTVILSPILKALKVPIPADYGRVTVIVRLVTAPVVLKNGVRIVYDCAGAAIYK